MPPVSIPQLRTLAPDARAALDGNDVAELYIHQRRGRSLEERLRWKRPSIHQRAVVSLRPQPQSSLAAQEPVRRTAESRAHAGTQGNPPPPDR